MALKRDVSGGGEEEEDFKGSSLRLSKKKKKEQSKPSHHCRELTERLVSGGEEEEFNGSSLRLSKKKKKKEQEEEEEEEFNGSSLRLSKKTKKEQEEEEFDGSSLRLSKKKRKKEQEEEEFDGSSLRLSKKKRRKEQGEEEEFDGSSLRLSKKKEQSKPCQCHRFGELEERLVELQIVVQEGFQNLHRILGSPPLLTPRPPTKTQKVARFQLHFDNKLPSTLFTDREIKAEDDNPIRIVIRDINSSEIVSSGPLSSLKIKIVVLDGEFCDDGQEWTEDEFLGHIKSERKGKRPLLTGGLDIGLSNGVGHLLDARFTDNSSWTKSGFRLGTVQCKDFSKNQRVREAVSEVFKVKDCHGELNQKDRPPLLDDEVCYLRNIRRNGPFHKKLLEAQPQIKTVQDFLRRLTVDPDGLHELFGRGMANKSWKTVVDHARECSPGDKLYYYSNKEKDVILVFNSIFQLHGATIDGIFLLNSCLTPSQKKLVDKLKSFAYKNYKDIDEFRGTLNDPPIPGSNVSPLEIYDGGITYDDVMRSHGKDEPYVTSNVHLNDRGSTLQVKQPNITRLQVETLMAPHPAPSLQHRHIPMSILLINIKWSLMGVVFIVLNNQNLTFIMHEAVLILLLVFLSSRAKIGARTKIVLRLFACSYQMSPSIQMPALSHPTIHNYLCRIILFHNPMSILLISIKRFMVGMVFIVLNNQNLRFLMHQVALISLVACSY